MASFKPPFEVATGCTIQDREGHQYRVGTQVPPEPWHGGLPRFMVTRLDTGETQEVRRSLIWEVCTLVSGPPDLSSVRHRERKKVI